MFSSIFFCKSAESGRFFIYLHDSNSIFWAQGIKSEGFLGRTVRNNKTEHKDLKASGMESTLEAETSFAVTTTAVNVQCVHKLQVRIVTSRKQYVDARAEQYVGGDKFSEVTKAGFCHAQHSFYKRLTATVRSSARPFGDDPFWHAVHGATSVNTQFHKNTVHDPHTNACP